MKILLLVIFFISCSTGSVKKTEPLGAGQDQPSVDSFYKIESSRDWIKEAVRVANCVTVNSDFHKEIISIDKYEHFTGDSKDIVKSLISSKVAIVGTYYKRFTKAIAYRNIGSDKIWYNTKHAGSSVKSKVKTMIHERLHVLGYGHKGNNPAKYNNRDSVPYKVSGLGEKYVEGCK